MTLGVNDEAESIHGACVARKSLRTHRRKIEDQTKSKWIQYLAQSMLSPISDDDLRERNESDLYGAVLGIWHQLNQGGRQTFQVKVFNPTLSSHGWKSSHTIIEIIGPDMPFLVDSVRMRLNRNDIAMHLMINGPQQITRDKHGKVTQIGQKGKERVWPFFILKLIKLPLKKSRLSLEQEIKETLESVQLVVADWQPMRQAIQGVIQEIKGYKHKDIKAESTQTIAFLNWLDDNNFTLMSYQYFTLQSVDGQYQLVPAKKGHCGLAKLKQWSTQQLPIEQVTASGKAVLFSPSILIINKANEKSLVRKPVYLDYIGVKGDSKGQVTGEHRFHGLYASSAYHQSSGTYPRDP